MITTKISLKAVRIWQEIYECNLIICLYCVAMHSLFFQSNNKQWFDHLQRAYPYLLMIINSNILVPLVTRLQPALIVWKMKKYILVFYFSVCVMITKIGFYTCVLFLSDTSQSSSGQCFSNPSYHTVAQCNIPSSNTNNLDGTLTLKASTYTQTHTHTQSNYPHITFSHYYKNKSWM